MRRTLWQMSDDQVFILRDAAHETLTNLWFEHTQWCTYVKSLEDSIGVLDPSEQHGGRLASNLRGANKHLDHLEQRIQAQRSFCASLDNECEHRNPPFWSADDLDRINRNRDSR